MKRLVWLLLLLATAFPLPATDTDGQQLMVDYLVARSASATRGSNFRVVCTDANCQPIQPGDVWQGCGAYIPDLKGKLEVGRTYVIAARWKQLPELPPQPPSATPANDHNYLTFCYAGRMVLFKGPWQHGYLVTLPNLEAINNAKAKGLF